MQVTENLSRIHGRVVARSPSTRREDWDDLTVRLERAEKVDDRAELLHDRVGTDVVISVPRELLGAAEPGDHVDGHVSVVGPGEIFASPQSVEGGRFEIAPADD